MLRLLCLSLILTFPALAQPDTRAIAQRLAVANEKFWRATQEPKGSVAARTLFAYAFVLCEANQNLERLEPLFDLAARMQDRNEASKSFGNFKWKWEDKAIVDYNAVDFSMRGGSLLWLKHRDKIPASARAKLAELLKFATQGCLRHKVNEAYTNIALMNAGDLILLGEAQNLPAVADEGYKRLERALLYTHEFGTHEYVSPTYYGPDLDALVMIEAYAKRERGVEQARALLNYFWHDIALNWFAPAQKLSGAHSRSYDYLRGLGEADKHFVQAGWLEGELRELDSIYTAQARWMPPAELKTLNAQYPRLVQQKWGVEAAQWRTNFVQRDVALSTAGASYGGKMDFPLTVDFPGPRDSVRCYFTSDGRGDPYGKIKIAESATHSKALHLNPLWTARQVQSKAIGIVRYRDGDIPPEAENLESHFVMPFDNDGLWIDDRKIEFVKGQAASFAVQSKETVSLRKGSAGLILRVPWSADIKGEGAPVSLVYDGNAFGAIRLTVTHCRGVPIGVVKQEQNLSGAAFVVNVGSDLKSDENLQVFRRRILERPIGIMILPGAGAIISNGQTFPVNLPAGAGTLWHNGQEIGRKILEAAEPLKSGTRIGAVPELKLPATGGVYFEAETGQIMPGFEIGGDAAASGGKFVWMPGEPGLGGGGNGNATWALNPAQPGDYTLWGRVMAATPDDDSFFVRLFGDTAEQLPATTWSIGTHAQWEWVRFDQKLPLPQGLIRLQLRVREDCAKIDRLFLTRDAKETPK